MSVAFVAYNTPSGTIPVTFGASNVTAGDQIYILAWTNSTGSGVFSISGAATTVSNILVSGSANFTDGHGDTYSLWGSLSAAAGTQNFTVSQPSGDALAANSYELEFSGGLSTQNAVYTTTANPGPGAGGVPGQAVTVASGDLLCAICYNADAFGNTPAINGTTWSGITVNTINGSGNAISTYIIGTGTSVTPSFTAAAGDTGTPHQVVQWVVSQTSSNTNSATVAWFT